MVILKDAKLALGLWSLRMWWQPPSTWETKVEYLIFEVGLDYIVKK